MSHGRPNTTEVVREQAKPSEGAKLVVLDEPFVAPETQDRAKKSATRKIAADKIVPASIRPPAVQVQALKNFTLPRQRANLPFEMTEDDGSSCGEFADVVNSQGIHHVQESEDTGNLEDPFALLMANTSQPPMEEMVEQTYPRSRADCSLTQVDNVADEDLSDSLFVEDRAGRAVDEATVVRHTAPCVTDDSKTPFPVTGDRQNLISRGYKRPGIYRGNQGRLPNRLKKVSSLGKKVFPIDICRSTKAAEPEQIQLQECSLPLVRESEVRLESFYFQE